MTSRISSRRRIVKHIGFFFLVVASATACIFDSGGDYKYGGRLGDLTATATAVEDAGEDAPISTTPATPDPFDGGLGGD
jgi:hypothetical protein